MQREIDKGPPPVLLKISVAATKLVLPQCACGCRVPIAKYFFETQAVECWNLAGQGMPIKKRLEPLCITTICIIEIAHIEHLALYGGCLNPIIVLCMVIITNRTIWISI
jgi:hypothetical protein